jgi:hypothetical protein
MLLLCQSKPCGSLLRRSIAGEDAAGVNHRRNPKQKSQAQLNEHLVISFKASNQK